METGGLLGRAVVVIIGAIAELERNLIIERLRAGMRPAKLEGRRIGHADRSQILARTSPEYPICEICGRRIEVERLRKAKRQGIRIATCSKSCQRELSTRNADRPAASSSTAASTVPKGLPKPNS